MPADSTNGGQAQENNENSTSPHQSHTHGSADNESSQATNMPPPPAKETPGESYTYLPRNSNDSIRSRPVSPVDSHHDFHTCFHEKKSETCTKCSFKTSSQCTSCNGSMFVLKPCLICHPPPAPEAPRLPDEQQAEAA